MTTRERAAGEPCWFNILSPKPNEARDFFAALLGWTFDEIPGLGGHMIHVGGHGIGAIFDVVTPQTPDGTDPVLGLVIKVASADDAAARAVALGGTATPAFDIGPAGRMSVIHDAGGAEFDALELRAMRAWDHDARLVGAPAWFERRARDAGDVDGAAAFYDGFASWRPASTKRVLKHGRREVASIGRAGGAESRWITFLAVADVAKSARLARKLGADVGRARDVNGKRAVDVTSPHGVAFGLRER